MNIVRTLQSEHLTEDQRIYMQNYVYVCILFYLQGKTPVKCINRRGSNNSLITPFPERVNEDLVRHYVLNHNLSDTDATFISWICRFIDNLDLENYSISFYNNDIISEYKLQIADFGISETVFPFTDIANRFIYNKQIRESLIKQEMLDSYFLS